MLFRTVLCFRPPKNSTVRGPSVVSTFFDKHEKGIIYPYLTNKDVDIDMSTNTFDKPIYFVFIIDFIILILVQVRIEIFKRTVVCRIEMQEVVENQDCFEMNFNYNNITIRIVLFLSCLCLFIIINWIFWGKKEMKEAVLGKLETPSD